MSTAAADNLRQVRVEMPTFDLEHGRFYHPPKRGGTWVYEACRNAGLVKRLVEPKHVGPHDAPAEVGFTIVRHPVTWWRSVYKNRRRWWAKDGRDLAGRGLSYYPEIDECKADTYPEFIRNVLERDIVHFWWDERYRHPCIRYILQQENLRNNLVDVLIDLGEKFDPRVILGTPRLGSRRFSSEYALPADLRAAILAACDQNSLRTFGYE